ncbi:hypothetical protein VT84_28490 [Gemmata sp. SH-PL17]|uniref:hypothetical protein n=1 Tax=Gemmata sp. SH-PL17 TaxID=1630693 RepID=UPI0004B91677|nr:hypothetical protein [Gemmata sp. SH-PL17]AMV28376.1 hypothetical protein VT84_28490 [Gemmata sp. SH-PL17]
MARKRIGGLPARYSFILNPYSDVRLSKCPRCEKLTHMRKFPLLIDIKEYGPLALGKTCRYCSKCELIMAHKNELDAEINHAMTRLAPAAVGNEYVVLGTMERKVWQQGLTNSKPLAEALEHFAEFKKVLTLEVQPGGWFPAEGPRKTNGAG